MAFLQLFQMAGDQAGVARAKENEKTAAYNKQVEAENQELDEIKAEAAAIEAELGELKGGRKTDEPPR